MHGSWSLRPICAGTQLKQLTISIQMLAFSCFPVAFLPPLSTDLLQPAHNIQRDSDIAAILDMTCHHRQVQQ